MPQGTVKANDVSAVSEYPAGVRERTGYGRQRPTSGPLPREEPMVTSPSTESFPRVTRVE